MNYRIRRIVAGAFVAPIVASAYFMFVMALVLAGAKGLSVSQAIANGLLFGIVASLLLVFAPEVSKVLDRVLAE